MTALLASPDTRASGTGGRLEVRDLRTTFESKAGTVEAVRGVSFTVEPGETMVLLGESGSGKSVTARSILRLHGPNACIEGSVCLGGRDLTALGERDLSDLRGAAMALVPQDPSGSLDPLRRCGAQIVEVLRRHRAETDRRAAWARAEELLAQVGIADPRRVARSHPHHLSGGMRQRVAIALAISCGPSLLVADEPTTALDVTVQAQILELFSTLQAELHMALLLVTHDIGVAEQVADRVGVMYAGRLVEHGPVGDVLASPRHPYTMALLESLPSPDSARGELRSIQGQPPVAGEHRSGCGFAPRCSYAQERCRSDEPTLVDLGGRLAACPVLNGAETGAA